MRTVLEWMLAAMWLGIAGCAHEEARDLPLYEDLLFQEIQKDKPKREKKYWMDEFIDDETEEEGSRPAVPLVAHVVEDWAAFLAHVPSHSAGKPSKGSLEGGRELPKEAPGLVRKSDKAPFGTDEAVAILLWAGARMLELYPGTVPLVIGDLSKEGGGKVKPHRSHQSGRDVDIGFYYKRNRKVSHFADLADAEVDWEKTWTYIDLLLSTNQVVYIFLDRSLHKALYDQAAERGWKEAELKQLFEAPLGNQKRGGLIRHQKGHKNHMHVRFACAPDDQGCE